MNKRKTNYLVSILNIVAIVAFYILYFTSNYLMSGMLTGTGLQSLFKNTYPVEVLLINIKLIMIIFSISIGLPNIVCGIQNKKDKKLSFWFIVFGIVELSTIKGFLIDDTELINKVLFIVIPIIFAIKNIICIKKNNSSKIQIISYILAIAVAIIEIFNLIGAGTSWLIVAIIMQLIYIHNQEDNEEESKTRKIINIVVYYILQALITLIFLITIIYSLIITKINETKFKSQISQIHNEITSLQGATISDIYVPVEKNQKYGFINESGEEKISCEYDNVSYFSQIEINNQTYYIALAKKENNYYIISKTNNNILIDGDEIGIIDNYCYKENPYEMGEIFTFGFSTMRLFLQKDVTHQYLLGSSSEVINLEEEGDKYYYKNSDYNLTIEPVESEESAVDIYSKVNVTRRKFSGEEFNSMEYLKFSSKDNTLTVCSNGYIPFLSSDRTVCGWYNNKGDKVSIYGNYEVYDIKDNKVILYKNENDNETFTILDMSGKFLLRTNYLFKFDNMYLIKKDSGRFVLMDTEFNEISEEYDKIICNTVQEHWQQMNDIY